MIPRAFDDLGPDDLDALVRDEVAESRTIEYKAALFENNDSGKKEFLADVSSFANAAGGDLIYGITAADGVPREVCGLPECNGERDLLRLDSIIRDGLAPRIPGVRPKWIQDHPAGPVLLLRIPRSWMGPHMVTFKDSSRFYSRSPAGKFQMDVAEIRAAFEGAAEIPARIQRWRDERLGRLVADVGPFPLGGRACFVMHIVPVESFVDEWRLSVPTIQAHRHELLPVGSRVSEWRINLDGVAIYVPERSARATTEAYTQVFRSGRIEATTVRPIQGSTDRCEITPRYYEANFRAAASEYLSLLRKLDVQPPYSIMLSLLNAKGVTMESDNLHEPSTPIDRDILTFPDALVEDPDCDLGQQLRPIYDSVWNACGLPCSRNFDKNGKWIGS